MYFITKKQSKQLRYIARANYKSEVKVTESANGKVKTRFFPVYGLSYDESKADKGMVELTNIKVLYKPFDGTYDELIERLHQILGTDEDAECEKVADVSEDESDASIGILKLPPRGLIKNEAECLEALAPLYKDYPPKDFKPVLDEKSDAVVTSEKPGDIIKETLKGMYPEGTQIDVDIKPNDNRIDVRVRPPGHSVDMQINIQPVVDDIKTTAAEVNPVEEPSTPEEPPVVETDFVGVPRNYLDKDATLNDAEIVEPTYDEVKKQIESAQKESVESCSPKVTAEQKPAVHLDAAEGKNDVTMVVEAPKPKKLSRAELYDLRIKCATMKLATSYGEKPDLDIGTIMARYTDASAKLTKFYAEDGIMPYTISEDAIRKAYPEEFEALK